MDDLIGRALVFNVLASLAAGLWATGVVYGSVRLFGIAGARTRDQLLMLPVAKSMLVLLGVVTVMPVPSGFWQTVRAEALPFRAMAPWLVVWIGLGLIGYELIGRRARRRALESGETASAGSRPARALERLRGAFEGLREAACCPPACELRADFPRPTLVLSERPGSPGVVPGEKPALILPRRLEQRLEDDELDGVLAHELAHLWLRWPGAVCTPRTGRRFAWLTPTNLFISSLLTREEELLCDEIAARVTGRPEALASALVKTYRFTRRERNSAPVLAAQLLGRRPLLRQRLKRLLEAPAESRPAQGLRLCAALALIAALVFVG